VKGRGGVKEKLLEGRAGEGASFKKASAACPDASSKKSIKGGEADSQPPSQASDPKREAGPRRRLLGLGEGFRLGGRGLRTVNKRGGL